MVALVISIAATIIAAVALIMSAWTSFKANRIAVAQLLPRVSTGTLAARRPKGGVHRQIEFEVEWVPGRPEWTIASAVIRRNWRRKRFLAIGEFEYEEVVSNDHIISHYIPRRSWDRRIVFDPPVRHGVVVVHPDAPDCEVLLKVTMSTSPYLTAQVRVSASGAGLPQLK